MMNVNIVKGSKRKEPAKKNESYEDYIKRVVQKDKKKIGMKPSDNLYIPKKLRGNPTYYGK